MLKRVLAVLALLCVGGVVTADAEIGFQFLPFGDPPVFYGNSPMGVSVSWEGLVPVVCTDTITLEVEAETNPRVILCSTEHTPQDVKGVKFMVLNNVPPPPGGAKSCECILRVKLEWHDDHDNWYTDVQEAPFTLYR